MKRALEVIVNLIARAALRIFFRRLDVVGGDRVPRSSPLVFVVNHYNSLIDPIVVLGELPRSPRFIATATLWERPILRPFLALGRVIPVYRQQDAPRQTHQNEKTFAACYDILENGGCIALFPEGRSHDEPELQPMKTGAARIILGTAQRSPAAGIRVVPVGLTYDRKRDFRSNALVKVGHSFDPVETIDRPDPEDREQVRAMTGWIGDALDAVTLSYPSWEEAHLINRAAELFAQGAADTPGERGLAEAFPVRKMFAEGYRVLKEREPQRVRDVADAVTAYDHMLVAYNLRHEHIVSRYPHGDVAVYVFRTVLAAARAVATGGPGSYHERPAVSGRAFLEAVCRFTPGLGGHGQDLHRDDRHTAGLAGVGDPCGCQMGSRLGVGFSGAGSHQRHRGHPLHRKAPAALRGSKDLSELATAASHS